MGEVFLNRWPLFVSLMESVFIALLCYHDTGLASPFRWYYLLSLICCAIRYRPAMAWLDAWLALPEPAEPGLSLGFHTPGRDRRWPLDDRDHGLGDLGELVAGWSAEGGRRPA